MSHSVLYVALALAALPAWAATADPQRTAELFDPNTVHEIRLYIHPNDWRTLQANFTENTYYQADFVWRDQAISSVGIRSRGRGSRDANKPGLRLDFNRYVNGQELFGLKSIILDNMAQDPSALRERLSMYLFARAGIPTPREAYCRLFINDQYWGLYSIIESIDKEFLQRTLGEDGGYLYEYSWIGEYYFQDLGDDPAGYVPLPFKPETHEDKPNPSALMAMIRTINQAPDESFEERVSEYLDPYQFLLYLAVEGFLAEHDGMTGAVGMNNFYLYQRKNSNQHVFIPWDKDSSFWEYEQPVMLNLELNVLARRLLATPKYRDYLLEYMQAIAAETGGEENWMFQESQFAYDLIRDAVENDSHKRFTYGEFEADIVYVQNFVRFRTQSMLAQLDELRKPAPEPLQ
jgi:spore coat protein CotH